MINIRDFKTKEEGKYRVCKLKTALKKSNEDLFYVRYLVGNVDREDYLDVVTSDPSAYCEEWEKPFRRVSRLEATADLKRIQTHLKLMDTDKVTLNISEEDEESLKISLEQSRAGIVVPFDLDDYIGYTDNIFKDIFKDTPIFKTIPFDAGGCSLQELYGVPEHNELPTLAEQLGESFEVRTHVYHNGAPVTLTPPTIEFHYAEGKSITMTELLDKIDKAIKAAETIQQYQSSKPL